MAYRKTNSGNRNINRQQRAKFNSTRVQSKTYSLRNNTPVIQSDNQYDTPFGTFSLSTSQGFYYIRTTETPLTSDDWIGAFTPSGVLVGARQVVSTSTMTDIPIMGNDGYFYSEGYMNFGEVPIFKVYIAAANSIIDAQLIPQTPTWAGGNQIVMVEGGIQYQPPTQSTTDCTDPEFAHGSAGLGCTDPQADNYNSNACWDDGTQCEYSDSPYDVNQDGSVNLLDAMAIVNGVLSQVDGITQEELIANGLDVNQNGSVDVLDVVNTVQMILNQSTDDCTHGSVDLGCTDPAAANYNSNACWDDGTQCEYD